MRRKVAICSLMGMVLAASAQVIPGADMPAFYQRLPKGTQKMLIAPDSLTGLYSEHEYQKAAYMAAAAIPEVLYQLPCYCRCDRALGHKSLHSCFESTHGAVCTTCMSEAIFAYNRVKAGDSPAQIRNAITHSQWASVDLGAIKASDIAQGAAK